MVSTASNLWYLSFIYALYLVNYQRGRVFKKPIKNLVFMGLRENVNFRMLKHSFPNLFPIGWMEYLFSCYFLFWMLEWLILVTFEVNLFFLVRGVNFLNLVFSLQQFTKGDDMGRLELHCWLIQRHKKM